MNRNNNLHGYIAGATLTLLTLNAGAENESFSAEMVKKGSAIYSQNCSPCHGPRMLDPQGAFDLRIFPKNERERFITSVSKGKNQMPPWGGLLNAVEIESLWAYVFVGDK